jgi:5-oxoprolinase (ATP-hydrolysing) subunit B
MYSEPRLLPCGDCALAVEFGDEVDEAVNQRVLALDRRLSFLNIRGIVETVPTYRSLLIHYDPLSVTFPALKNLIVSHLG